MTDMSDSGSSIGDVDSMSDEEKERQTQVLSCFLELFSSGLFLANVDGRGVLHL